MLNIVQLQSQRKSLCLLSVFIFLISVLSLRVSAETIDTQLNDDIIVAIHVEAPAIARVNGKYTGYYVEAITDLAASIDRKVRFVECPFARCLAIMKEGLADMMIGVRKTKEREAFLTYLTKPISNTIFPVRFFQEKSAPGDIKNYNDLLPLTIGVLRGAKYFDEFDNDAQLSKIELTTHNQLIDMLLGKRIDVLVGGEQSIKTQTTPHIYNNRMKMAPYRYDYNVQSFIVISKKSLLVDQVDLLSTNLDYLLVDGELKSAQSIQLKHTPETKKE